MKDIIPFFSPNVASEHCRIGYKMYWGYLHSNGTIQVKRWLGDHADYTSDCFGNPFVLKVVRPFIAPNDTLARDFIELELKK